MTKKTNQKGTSKKIDRSAQPVAPAPGRLLAGVVFLSVVGLSIAANARSDVLAVAGCIVVLSAGVFVLDVAGRKQAAAHPHPLYVPGRLPADSPKLKVLGLAMTIAFLTVTVALTAAPDREPSPFPFFIAGAWVMLVLPQALARRAIRRYDEGKLYVDGSGSLEGKTERVKAVKNSRAKKRKRKHKKA